MILKPALTALLLTAAAAPAQASDWYYVDYSSDFASISFVDRDSIKGGENGSMTGWMYAVLPVAEQGDASYRFTVEIDCVQHRQRLKAVVAYDEAQHAGPDVPIDKAWSDLIPGSQGESIANFICSKGTTAPAKDAAGSALPFQKGRQMLADLRAGKAN